MKTFQELRDFAKTDAGKDVYVNGQWLIDRFGNIWRAVFRFERNRIVDLRWKMPPIVSLEELRHVLPGIIVDGHSFYAPDDGMWCAECSRTFALDEVYECVYVGPDEFLHKECAPIHLERKEAEHFRKILDVAGWSDALLVAIENEYMAGLPGQSGAPPWFLAKTRRGNIKIGWRKRVISIEWADVCKCFRDRVQSRNELADQDKRRLVEDALLAHALFHGEDVTKNSFCIHAHGVEKAIEYLQALKTAVDALEKDL